MKNPLLRAILFVALASAPAYSAPAYVNAALTTATATVAGTVAAPAASHTTGNLLVMFTSFVDAGNTINVSSVADTAGNTWTAGTRKNASGATSQMWYAKNIAGNASNVVTATLSTTTDYRSLLVLQYSGCDATSPLDVEATPASGASGSATSSAFTTLTADVVIVAMAFMDASATAGSGYTMRSFGANAAGEDKIVSSVQTGVTATMGNSGGGNPWSLHVMAFKQAATLGISPGTAITGQTGLSFTLTGTGTSWTPGTPGSPTFTMSGGTGASITAQSVASTTSATITVTAGSAAGTLTITDPGTGATTTITVNTASLAASPTTSTTGLSGVSVTLTGVGTSWSAGTPGTPTFTLSGGTGASITAQTVASSTSATVTLTTGSAAATLTITDPSTGKTATITVLTATLVASPTTSTTGLTGVSIALTGGSTSWTSGTPGSPTFTLAGGTGASITSQSVTDATHATVVLTTGSAAATLTITDPSTTKTATVTVSLPPNIINVTDANFVFSPYNWYSDGAGALGSNNVHGSSTFAQCDNAGCYVKTVFSGTAATLNYSTPQTTGSFPIFHWSVDNGAIATHTLTSGETSTVLATGLANTTHTLFLYVAHLSFTADRWTTPTASIKITGITIDTAATLSAPSGAIALRASKAIFFGDSITEGFYAGGINDANLNYVPIVAEALQAEFGQIGFSATGWNTAYAPNNNLSFTNSWNFYFSTNSRLVAGKLSPQPDYVFINHGTNDSSGVAATVTSTLAAIRAAVTTTTPIFVLIPFGQQQASAIATGITNAADPFVFKIDCGAAMAFGVNSTTNPSRLSSDGLHPNQLGHALFGGAVSKRIGTALGTGASAYITFQ